MPTASSSRWSPAICEVENVRQDKKVSLSIRRSNWVRRLSASLSVIVLLTAAMPAVLSAELYSPEQLLELLQARDAMLDNVELKYAESGVVIIPPYQPWRRGETTSPAAPAKPERCAYTDHVQLVVRGVDTTLIRTRDDKLTDETAAGLKVLNPYQKTSNARRLFREMAKFDMKGRGSVVLDIDSRPAVPVDLIREAAMKAEFAHGLGFGKRIKQIEEISQKEGRIVANGTIGIWWEDISRFELELDEDLVVRRASILSDVKGSITGFEVTTAGTVTHKAIKLARTGSFSRFGGGVTWLDGRTEGKRVPINEVSITHEDLTIQLSDESYEALIDFPREPGMQVNDKIAGVTYFIGPNGEPELNNIDLSDLQRLWAFGNLNLAATEALDGPGNDTVKSETYKDAMPEALGQISDDKIKSRSPSAHEKGGSLDQQKPVIITRGISVWRYTLISAIVVLFTTLIAILIRSRYKRYG